MRRRADIRYRANDRLRIGARRQIGPQVVADLLDRARSGRE
jgi:hypothetical protein